ncbi:hypothetical protein [Priestia megaterium]|jgi:hypothetical protein|uniref:hypothetical protein n=1 Tax=Priestia megaterium TaxID=1404 RepID=UPI0006ABA661|nr:hypothetical protein [Priestia megaterium]KOP70785.1 hypothetical protein AMS61_26020 [Bacillus sp. FJAT-21351]MBU8590079.1 hypothetical protein [Priestia megaterium]QSX23496.1 hypothetical protein J0P05_28215 [Priestia megaterium]
MLNENQSVQETMESFWRTTCGTWENCNESTVQAFLSQCEQHSIDPQFCMNWIQQHRDKIPNWSTVSDTTREWVNEHTSTGSPVSMFDQKSD